MGAALTREEVALRGRRLEYFTIVWNSLEGFIAVAAGALAGSISLVGFGIDSFIEVTSGSVLLWRMVVDADVRCRERNEKLSLRTSCTSVEANRRMVGQAKLIANGNSTIRDTPVPCLSRAYQSSSAGGRYGNLKPKLHRNQAAAVVARTLDLHSCAMPYNQR
jgi:hypothetical protein